MIIFRTLILRCSTKSSLEGRMSGTGSSFEAPLRFAPQDEVGGFQISEIAGEILLKQVGSNPVLPRADKATGSWICDAVKWKHVATNPSQIERQNLASATA